MKSTKIIELINPATNEKFLELSIHSLEEAKEICNQAKNTQQKWKLTTISERIKVIMTAMNYFKSNSNKIAQNITEQMGKPISQSYNEIRVMIQRAEKMCALAEESLKIVKLTESDGIERFIQREPLGVILNIPAWNYPLLTAVNVIIPSILAGNSVIIKHSSITPLCANDFETAFLQSDAPSGLVSSMLLEHSSTKLIIQSDLVNHVAFTGSVMGGKIVNQYAASKFIDVGLELGGKDPAYIREDADISSAISNIMDGVFYNGGQSCCSVERIYIHKSLYYKFLEGATSYMNQLIIDNPMNKSTTLGPMAQKAGINTIKAQLDDAENKGAKITYYSGNLPEGNNFILPAILTQTNHSMDLMLKETFGPVIGIMSINNDEEAIKLMNDSPYGLTASVWTKDLAKATEIGKKIDTGTFFMNRCDYLDPELPWIGTKNSGRGCTLSSLGIQQLTRPKSFHLKLI